MNSYTFKTRKQAIRATVTLSDLDTVSYGPNEQTHMVWHGKLVRSVKTAELTSEQRRAIVDNARQAGWTVTPESYPSLFE